MATAGELGGKESLHTVAGGLDADQPGAERQYVGVVMLAAQPGAGGVVAQCGTAAGDPVGGDGNADTGAADGDAEAGLAGRHGLAQGAAEIGIIDAFRAIGPEVEHTVDRKSTRLNSSH